MSRQAPQKKRNPQRPSWWSQLDAAASQAHLRGNRQWDLLRLIARLGHGKNRTRNVMFGRRKLAQALGLDPSPRPREDPLPRGRGNHDPGGTNTRRRLARLEELGLVLVVGPVILRGGEITGARGGRKRGCSSDALVGRALRIYPGRELMPRVLVNRQVKLDDLADAGVIDWAQVKPLDQVTAGEALALEQLAQAALRRRGPP